MLAVVALFAQQQQQEALLVPEFVMVYSTPLLDMTKAGASEQLSSAGTTRRLGRWTMASAVWPAAKAGFFACSANFLLKVKPWLLVWIAGR